MSFEELCDSTVDILHNRVYQQSDLDIDLYFGKRDILYDGQIYLYQTYGGVSRYFEELINGISTSYLVDLFMGVNISKTSISERVRILYNKAAEGGLLSSVGFRRSFNRMMLNEFQKSLGRYRVYHSMYYEGLSLELL